MINDIAVRTGSYATTYQLTRTAIGPFNLLALRSSQSEVGIQAINLTDIKTIDDIARLIIPVEDIDLAR